MELTVGPTPGPGTEVVRRALDVIAGSVLLLLTAPLLGLGVLIVAIAGGRPVFFAHRRLGRHGRPFRCWKLRTMRADAEEALDRDPELLASHRSNGFKLPTSSDPRVTWWGRLLRRTYVDELPQFFNVVAGCMSLVGPRPIVADELELFGEDRNVLLTVKPGVFGAWNSRGRDRPPYPERADLELDYVRNRAWTRDIKILIRSIRAVLQGQDDL